MPVLRLRMSLFPVFCSFYITLFSVFCFALFSNPPECWLFENVLLFGLEFPLNFSCVMVKQNTIRMTLQRLYV